MFCDRLCNQYVDCRDTPFSNWGVLRIILLPLGHRSPLTEYVEDVVILDIVDHLNL